MILSIMPFAAPPRAPRARERPAPHRDPLAGRRRRALDRLRGGGLFAAAWRRASSSTPTTVRFIYSSMTTPTETYDYDMDARERTLLKRQEVPSGHDPSAYVTRRADGDRAGRRARCRSPPAPPRPDARPFGALPALRLRRLRHRHARASRHTGACRSSIAASSTPSPISAAARRRAGAGTRKASASTRPTLHATSSPPRDCLAGNGYTAPGRIVAQGGARRRNADGRRRQPGAGPLRAHHRRSALRRRAQHHARRDAAAHAAGMAGMGQPDRQRSGFPHDRRLLALRERRAPEATRHPRRRRPHRSARHLLGAGQVGGPDQGADDRGWTRAAAHRHGFRAWRRVRPFRPPEGGRPVLCLRNRHHRGPLQG